ncbi:MAG: ATP-binding protein [Chloroflexi bacterium]|nr:ATP-binding protein [Chloroflexota bacterium]
MQQRSLDDWFPRDAQGHPLSKGTRIGVVVGGSLSKGLKVKLDRDTSIESLAVGRYVVVRGVQKRFFCMVTDIQLDVTNAALMANPPDLTDPFLSAVYSGTAAFGTIHVAPMLMIDEDTSTPRPVKTIPSHFTQTVIATVEDVNDVFGKEDETHFNVGAPLELEQTQINLDLLRLVERSVGVFGKSGTGKSFLTRILLAGTIQRDMAVNLIFDMHNDYGWEVADERGPKVKGLKQLFPSKVTILTLDEESSRRRKAKYDSVVTIGYNEIEPQDIEMLKGTLDLTDSMIDVAYMLRKRIGEDWIQRFMTMEAVDLEDLIAQTNYGASSITALSRRLARFERWEFLKPEGTGQSVQEIINLIIQKKHVVLEFGRYGNTLAAYILVANYLTRRIHEYYVEQIERSLGDKSMAPPQLLITIEEAHKFLDPGVARQTIFGTIARELRKYNVTMLVVDQRPSGIDEEVMSQIGTRVTALLDNERDIVAVLTGISGAGGLREVLSRLDTKQQAIIMGHAVPMPVVIKIRPYDQEFYAAMDYEANIAEAAQKARRSLGDDGGQRRL